MRHECNKNKKKYNLIERVGSRLDISGDIINGIHVDIRGRNNITVQGCKKILLYTTHEVRIKLSGEVICVRGEELYCTAYHSGVVEIDGYIIDVCFL